MVKLTKYMHFSSIVTCIRTKEGLGLMEIVLKSSACRRPTRPSDARLDQVSKISLGLESWTRYALTKHGDPSSSSFVGSRLRLLFPPTASLCWQTSHTVAG